MTQETDIGVDRLSAVSSGKLVRVERVENSDYVLAHTEDMSLVYGGLVNEDGLEKVQVMLGDEAARFDPETLELEYVSA